MQVSTPVQEFTGTVAGVRFVDGTGETDDPTALAYFRRHGYRLAAADDEPGASAPDQPSGDKRDGAGDQEAADEGSVDEPGASAPDQPSGNEPDGAGNEDQEHAAPKPRRSRTTKK